jgi:MFS family permease
MTSLFSRATRPFAILIAAGIALHSANVYVAAAVMPSVAGDIGGLSLYAWATTVFVLAAVLGSAATTPLLARTGARGAYRLAILVVGAGTALCALAPAMPVLLAGRFIQGLGGGLLFALGFTLIRIVLPESLWARAMALLSAMWGVGTFAGPALGGTFAELGEWRVAFWAIVPVTAFFAAWGAAQLPREAGRQASPPALPLLSIALLGASVLTLSAASVSTSPAVNGAGLLGAAILLVLWLRYERGAETRLLPAATFARDGRVRGLYVTMALLMLAATPEVFVSYFGQQLQELGPLAAGYLGTAMAAGWTTASIVVRRAGMTTGPVVSVAGLTLLVLVGPLTGGSAAVIAGVALGFVALGWGIGMTWPLLVTAVLEAVPEHEGDRAGASVTTIQLTAAAAGAAIGGTIVNLAGFADGVSVAPARWLYIAMLVAPLLIIARRLAWPVREPVVA